jgi:hypothetical protein
MRSVPLVRAFWEQPFLRFFREIGAPVDRYPEEAKLPPEVDEASELPCPSRLLYGMTDKLVHNEGIRDVGVTVDETTKRGSWGSSGHWSRARRPCCTRAYRGFDSTLPTSLRNVLRSQCEPIRSLLSD